MNIFIHFVQDIKKNLKKLMGRNDFISDSVEMMYYKCHKANFRHGGSYMDLPDWLKRKKATIKPKNIDNKCFQYSETVALNFGEIKWDLDRVSNIKPFINKYNWKGINYSSKMNNWKRIVKNNLTIALNILYIKGKKCRLYLTESYNEENDEGYFVELMFNILKITCASYFIMNYHFYLKERKLEKSESLLLIYMIKMNMLFT